ncbi:MAG: hypothetical protein IVW52_05005 [Acidimicrobiales bacterium]|nr:hypothetical protein [Acidimicrobiales bacterium]
MPAVVRLPKLRETAGPLGFLCVCGGVHPRGTRPHTPLGLRGLLRRRGRP